MKCSGVAGGLLVLMLLSFLSCAAPRRTREDLMPYHVAIVPIESSMIRASAEGGDDAASLQLLLDGETFAGELRAALEERCFVKVSLLKGTGVEGALLPGDSWERVAREELGADLLLNCRLWSGNSVDNSLNGWAWGSFLVFSLGGPFCWFFPDRTYSAEAGAAVTALDLSSPSRFADSSVGDWVPNECFEHTEILEDVDLDFFQRVGDSYWYYLVSMLIPSLFLAANHDGLEEDLTTIVTEELSVGMAEGLFQLRTEIARNESRYDFYLGPDEVSFEDLGGGRFAVEFVLYHDGNSRPGMYRVQVGSAFDETIDVDDAVIKAGEAAGAIAPSNYYRFQFREVVSVGPEDQLLRLSVRTFGVRSQFRSFSIPLP